MALYGFSFALAVTSEILPADFVSICPDGSQAVAYPESFTFSGATVDAGFSQISGESRERGLPDNQFSGLIQRFNIGDVAVFRIDLPSTGTYDIQFAAGDQQYGGSSHIRVYDDTTEIINISNGFTSAGDFIDATGATHAQADFDANATAVQHTFTSTTMLVEIGSTSSSGNATKLAWVSATSVGGGGGGNTAPVIDNIDGDNEVRAGQQNVVITGTNIENATSATLGGEPLTIV